jgi:Ca2+-transporting ATPase
MLWINLMMDILGAIAIGTEPYNKGSHQNLSKRISRKDSMIKLEMWRNIVVQSVYQIVVCLVLMYFGNMMFFDSFNLITTPLRDADGVATDKLRLNTIIFNTFFLMNWFNTLNSRVVDKNELNIFKTLFNNKFLWLVMGAEMFGQFCMLKAGTTELGSALLGTTQMTLVQHIICWCLGVFTLILQVIGKKIPLEYFEFALKIDLESDTKNSAIDRYMNKYDDMYKKANTLTQDQTETEQKDDE